MAELTPSGLRVLLAVAERGSFTAAAATLGYTQSAVSRQAATLEAAVGQPLFERLRGGVRLTAAGSRLLPRARHIVDELAAALADGSSPPTGRVRLGSFPLAIASSVPDALVQLRDTHPGLVVTVREATTPALVRSIRAGTLDLALVAQTPPYRPLDADSPALEVTVLAERDLMVAVGPGHRLAGRRAVEVGDLAGQVWIAGPSDGGDATMGVWPGLAERAEVRYVVRDWLSKLRLVAAGLAITTVSPSLAPHLPEGVRLLAVRGGPQEARRLSIVRLPGGATPEVTAVAAALGAGIGDPPWEPGA
ncbi:LysR family transcriptional regulator [soil metagenome]